MHQCRNPDEEIRGLEVISFLDYQISKILPSQIIVLHRKQMKVQGNKRKFVSLRQETRRKKREREKQEAICPMNCGEVDNGV